MSYQDKIKKHFEKYKKEQFENVKNGYWKKVEKGHIFPKDKENLNLLPLYRNVLTEYLDTNVKRLKKHIYFHHLNSSQVMCLNFFYPFQEEKKLDLILLAIGIKNEEILYENCCFEKKSAIELKAKKNYRPTYFDYYIETKSGKKIYFEIKYTEQSFAKVKADNIHTTKFKDAYSTNLTSIKEEYCNEKSFLENYQIMRNVICISDNSYVVFLYPNDNKKIKLQAEIAKQEIIKDELKDHLINITWESLISLIKTNSISSNMQSQLNDFKEKYIV
jgi:hypothetical protein